jgi:hypothetical protein
MDYLRRFAEEYGLAQIIGTLTEYESVQGAILSPDEWWLRAWQFNEAGRLREWEHWHHMRHRFGPWSVPFFDSIPPASTSWIPRRPVDLSWRPPFWDEYGDVAGRGSDMPPVRLTVCLRPPEDGEKTAIPELTDFRLPTVFETRPIARLAAPAQRKAARPVVGGVSIGSGATTYGTLGGIVEDGSGQRYGVTCAHVMANRALVDQPAAYDSRKASRIGRSHIVTVLQNCLSPTPCSPYTNDSHISDADLALIHLDTSVPADLQVLSIGPLSGVVARSSLTTGQRVEFVGRTSGLRVGEIGGLAVFYRLQMNGNNYCFRDLFEVRWGNAARQRVRPIVQDGDSGSWVCTPAGKGMGWCGQVIGQDRNVGYAVFAETLANRCGFPVRVA